MPGWPKCCWRQKKKENKTINLTVARSSESPGPLAFPTVLSPPSSALVTPSVPLFFCPRRKLGLLFHKDICHHTSFLGLYLEIYMFTHILLLISQGVPPIPGTLRLLVSTSSSPPFVSSPDLKIQCVPSSQPQNTAFHFLN